MNLKVKTGTVGYLCYGLCFKLAITILGNTVLNFCVRLFIMHHKLIRFKTSFIIDA